ncbi:ureidoglycolate lyase [Alloyangia pacifica]|uniref:ureidoglycolate lyase n=1 Tax=Alloyangia pacifica TaxID=311180 RepID=UPI001CD54C31|nr:ureidoglycolate lyase [Alloyangia pacifica]MCA0998082.1 ureidoglycolate lyase [Alloyangia pacifica]
MTQAPCVLTPQLLTSEAFAPYGEVIAHRGTERRHPVALHAATASEGLTVASWVSRLKTAVEGVVEIAEMERHPFSDQAFVPLSGQRFLIVVCDDADGLPDPATARAFVTTPGQGVIYRRNVWHAGMQVFDAPAEFFVQMQRHPQEADDIFMPVSTPIHVLPAEELV